MSDRRAELVELTTRFVDAFNRQDLDDVVGFFSEDADLRGQPRRLSHRSTRRSGPPSSRC